MAFCFVGGLLPAMEPVRMDLTGKIAIVTGSNSGVGYGFALQLAEMGATVYLACRNESRAAQAQSDMLVACPNAKIRTASLDTASFASVKAFVRNWDQGPIDILAHNVGVSNSPKGKVFTEDDFEFIYQVEPQFHGYGGTSNYAQSKLMQIACARALHDHFNNHKDNKRLVYTWEPGLVKSNLLRDVADTPHDPAIWLLGMVQPMVGLEVRQGSATGVHLATSDAARVVENVGRYFDRMQPRAHDANLYSSEKLDLLFARLSADAEVFWER